MNDGLPPRPESSPAPITLFTFLLELPFAVPFPNNVGARTLDVPGPGWDGWTPDLRRQLTGLPGDLVPGTRILVRHHQVNVTPSLLAPEEVFADWSDPLRKPEDIPLARAERAAWRDQGLDVMQSVVALTRFVPRSKHPMAAELTHAWVRSLFELALADLNQLLAALGLVLHRWDLGAVTFRDLPALLPVLAETAPRRPDRNEGTRFLVRLHDAYPAPSKKFDPERKPVEEAIALVMAANHGQQQFMLAFRFLHAAMAEQIAGDPTRAVVDFNTAVEIIVSVVLREGGSALGWDATRIEKATGPKTSYASRVRHHLAKVLAEEIDTADAATAWGRWWEVGYQKRNSAVHRGEKLTGADAATAAEACGVLIRHIKDRLAVNPDLAALSKELAMSIDRAAGWKTELVEGVVFPWE